MRRAIACLLTAALAACGDADRAADRTSADTAPPPRSAQPTRSSEPARQASVRVVPIEQFTGVPAIIRAAFRAQGCAVPQTYGSEANHNVISGDFASAGQTDWAALCVQGDSAAIVVVWAGKQHCPSVFAWASLASFMQQTGADSAAYSRAIGPLSGAQVGQRWHDYGGPVPQSVHGGIEDAFLEKASVVHYCSAGVWLTLGAAD